MAAVTYMTVISSFTLDKIEIPKATILFSIRPATAKVKNEIIALLFPQ
jgi:hypothetical protein